MPDELVRELLILPPLGGFRDGIDPALPDDDYSPSFAPVLENIRVRGGKLETRFGTAISRSTPTAGAIRLFGNYYPVAGTDAAKRIRIMVQNAAFYYLIEGTHTTFKAASGGGSLGTTFPYYSHVQLQDRVYFVDGVGALRRFESSPTSGNQVRTVALPVAPAAAPTFVVKAFKYFTKWDAAEVVAPKWTETSGGNFDIALATATDPSPGPYGGTASLTNTTLSGAGARVTRNASGANLESLQWAFYVKGDEPRPFVSFDVGQATVADSSTPISPTLTDAWQTMFVDTSAIPAPNFVSFKNIRSKVTGEDLYVSDILLPGKLDGQYRYFYTHYDPTTGRESAPSPITNSGFPITVTGQVQGIYNSDKGIARSVALMGVTDSGTDATTTKMRFYRNGGTPSLIKDGRGRDVWYRIATISDITANSHAVTTYAVGDVAVEMAANPNTTGYAVGDWIVIDKGTVGAQEFVKISGLTATHIQFTATPLIYAHGAGIVAQVIANDNTANSEIDTTTPIDIARNDPPSAAQWIARSPDGRLYLANLSGKPTGLAISNKPTPDRPEEYEVFPSGVDPITTRSSTQGFQIEIGGDVTDESIMWMGFYRDVCHILTKTNLYRVRANSQLDWGPLAVSKVNGGTGCLNGHTVAEVDGVLYWVSPGPQVSRWDGTGPVELVSDDRIRGALTNAPSAYWNQWFARSHSRRDGKYYLLWMTPSGQTTNTYRLDYNADFNLWEPNTWYNAGGSLIAFDGAAAAFGGTGIVDAQDLFAVSSGAGNVYQMETGSTDARTAIRFSYTSKSYNGQATSLLKDWFALVTPGGTDTLTLTVTTFGSEYGSTSHTYTLSLTGTADVELWERLHRDLLGRYMKVSITGSVNNRPSVRTQRLRYLPFRERRVTL